VPIELAFLRFFILRPALSYSSSSFVSSEWQKCTQKRIWKGKTRIHCWENFEYYQ
jgi:hypothetical protein